MPMMKALSKQHCGLRCNAYYVLALIIEASLGSYIRANCKVGINPGIPKRSLTLISCLSHQDGLGSEAIIQ